MAIEWKPRTQINLAFAIHAKVIIDRYNLMFTTMYYSDQYQDI